MKKVREIYAGRKVSGLKIIIGCTLMLAISIVVIGCDSIVDQKTDTDVSLSTSSPIETNSIDVLQSACINSYDSEYSEKTESKTVEWGNTRNPSTKTVDIIYYNTLDQFVLKVKSSQSIADVLVDDKSIKNFKGTLSKNTWQEFTFQLEEDWQAGDTWAFEVKITGSGPPILFDVEYQLIGECVDSPPDASCKILVTEFSFELVNDCEPLDLSCARINFLPTNHSESLIKLIDIEAQVDVITDNKIYTLGPIYNSESRTIAQEILEPFNSLNHEEQEEIAMQVLWLGAENGFPTVFLNPGESVEDRDCCGYAARFGIIKAIELSDESNGQDAIFRYRFIDEYGDRINNQCSTEWDETIHFTLPLNTEI